LPVAGIGATGFTSLALLSIGALMSANMILIVGLLALSAAGVIFAVYLIYTELAKLQAICSQCTASHILGFTIFGLALYALHKSYSSSKHASAV
jgi:uncharacterized membrane protein